MYTVYIKQMTNPVFEPMVKTRINVNIISVRYESFSCVYCRINVAGTVLKLDGRF